MTHKEDIAQRLEQARVRTLAMLDLVPDDYLRARLHSFYSPVGWHFGHIARTEEYWICRALRLPLGDEALSFLFADLPTNPKENRVNLPLKERIVQYLNETRQESLRLLQETELDSGDALIADGYAWEFAYQHECQHQETITELFCLMQRDIDKPPTVEPIEWKQGVVNEEVAISGGSFAMGSDWRHAYDNEKPPQDVVVQPFKADRYPVTALQWTAFMADGGYKNDSLWSADGRVWRDKEGATMPEYWKLIDGTHYSYAPTEVSPVHPDQPVQGISWFEAQAYCKWAGRRLLTETEAEFLRHNHQPSDIVLAHGPFPAPAPLKPSAENHTGHVWEWTSSPFRPYPGFQAFPYEGYSAAHMEGEHYVCRGGSWATTQVIRRPSFRNWYVPGYRQGFLGLRTASP